MIKNTMAKATFSIAYDGPALNDGSMDVRDLATALFATSDLFRSTGRVIYGREVKIKVNVRATGNGSFLVDLDFFISNWERIRDLFNSDSVQAIATIIATLGGLIGFYRWLKGRKISAAKTSKDGLVDINVGEHQIQISENVYSAYESIDVHIAIKKLIHDPLESEGITEFRIEHPDMNVTVSKDESEYFSNTHSAEHETIENVAKKVFKIVSHTFKSENKWQLSDGSSTIYAAMADEDFLDKVEKGLVSFTKGDTLVCQIRTIQKVDDHGNLTSKYVIERVIKHVKPPDLPQLPES